MYNPFINLAAIVGTIIVCTGLIPTMFLLWPGSDWSEPDDDADF